MAQDAAYGALLAQVEVQIERFNNKRRRNQRWYAVLAIAQIIAGVTASLVLGLSLPEGYIPFAKNAALVLTSATTISTLVLANFQFKDHFVGYTWVVSQLKQLRSDMKFRHTLNPPTGLDSSELLALHGTFSSILSESNTAWKARAKQAGSKTTEEQPQ
jgi:hypothetical protein